MTSGASSKEMSVLFFSLKELEILLKRPDTLCLAINMVWFGQDDVKYEILLNTIQLITVCSWYGNYHLEVTTISPLNSWLKTNYLQPYTKRA